MTATDEKAIDKRPTFEQVFMEFAVTVSRRSTCRRLHVGAVIVSSDFRRVVALGYNGNASGLANECDRDVPGNCGCLCAEENAVINCDAPREVEKVVFVTHVPCPSCAKRLINLGNVRRVVFKEYYKSRESLPLFAEVGIEVYQLVEGRLIEAEPDEGHA